MRRNKTGGILTAMILLFCTVLSGCSAKKPKVIVYDKNFWNNETAFDTVGETAVPINAKIQFYTAEPGAVFELISYEGENIDSTKVYSSVTEGTPQQDYFYRDYYYGAARVSFFPKDFPFSVSSVTYSINGDEHTAEFDPPLRSEYAPDDEGMEIVGHSGIGFSTSAVFGNRIPTLFYGVEKEVEVTGFELKEPGLIKSVRIVGVRDGRALFDGELDKLLPIRVPAGAKLQINVEADFDDTVDKTNALSGCLASVLSFKDVETGKEHRAVDNLWLSGTSNEELTQELLDRLLAELEQTE